VNVTLLLVEKFKYKYLLITYIEPQKITKYIRLKSYLILLDIFCWRICDECRDSTSDVGINCCVDGIEYGVDGNK
jgi:hypothetical protein